MAQELTQALRLRDPESALYLLSRKKIDLNLPDANGRTPLHLACEDETMLGVVDALVRR